MSLALEPLIAAVIDLRPGSRDPDLFAIEQAVHAACHGGNHPRSSPTPQWHDEIEYLVTSLRHFGGSLRRTPIEVHYVGTISPLLARRLSEHAVSLRPVAVMEARNPHANKLHMLATSTPYDILIMLDLDTIVAGDFCEFLRPDVIQAMPMEWNRLSIAQWTALYDYLGVPMPTARYSSPVVDEEIVPYFNTGVILAPRQYAMPLHHAWLGYIRLLLDRWPELPDEITQDPSTPFFIDEIAFALAVQVASLPISPLPLRMNFRTNLIPRSPLPDVPLQVIHNYHRVTNLGLLDTPFDAVNTVFATLNEIVLAESRGASSSTSSTELFTRSPR